MSAATERDNGGKRWLLYPRVERGIPMPDQSRTGKALPTRRHNHDKRRTVYPFQRMNVGDSFFIPSGKAGVYVAIHNYRYNVGRNGNLEKQFAVRQWWDGSIHGFRVWRIK